MSRPFLYVMVFAILLNTCSTNEIAHDIHNEHVSCEATVEQP